MAQPIDAVLADAARLTAAGRPRAAIEALRPVLADHPDHAGAWCGLAAAFLDVGEPQHCLDAAKRAITLGEPAWAHRLASLALTELGRHEEAAISARESARRNPDDWRGQVALAEALAATALDDALTAARRAVAIAPDEPRTHEVLGATAERAGDTDAACAAYQEALRIDPGNPDVQAALARLGRAGNGSGRFGDVPWERSTAWREVVPDEPDWTIVDAGPARQAAGGQRSGAKRPAAARAVRFGAAPRDGAPAATGARANGNGAATADPRPETAAETPKRADPGTNGRGPHANGTAPDPRDGGEAAGREANGRGPRVAQERQAGPGPDGSGPRGGAREARPRRDRRFGRAQRIGLWLALRRSSGWLALGALVLVIAGMPEPSRLLAWFGLALVLLVAGAAGLAVFRLPADIRLTPRYLWAHDRLMTIGAGVMLLGLAVLAGWTVGLALGATALTPLAPVVLLGALAAAVGTFGLWRMRIRR